nr:MAG TPA: hypothetical protein [Caudoviricetes sp.]
MASISEPRLSKQKTKKSKSLWQQELSLNPRLLSKGRFVTRNLYIASQMVV